MSTTSSSARPLAAAARRRSEANAQELPDYNAKPARTRRSPSRGSSRDDLADERGQLRRTCLHRVGLSIGIGQEGDWCPGRCRHWPVLGWASRWRTTTTGQRACELTCRLTEPRSMPTKPPCPRDPTTRRSALVEASVRTFGGRPWATVCLTSTLAASTWVSASSSLRLASISQSSASATRSAPYPMGCCQVVTTSRTQRVQLACRTAQRRASIRTPIRRHPRRCNHWDDS